jgi:2'-5' RNA ligase
MTRIRHLEAVQALEEEATSIVLAALSDVMGHVTDVIGSVTAAAEPAAEPSLSADDLAHIQTGWTVAVDGTIMPWYRTVFLAGADAATEQVSDMRDIPIEIIGDSDPLLLNDLATTHLATARNRFLLVGQDTWAAARDQMLQGFAAGEGIDPIRKRLQEVVDLSKSQATAVARTEVISASNAGAIGRVRTMGTYAPKFKQWLATNDIRTRLTHSAADNTVVPLDAKFIVGAASLDYPGDPSGPDDEVINCRCTPIFVDDPQGDTTGLDITEDVAVLVASGYSRPWLQVPRVPVHYLVAEHGPERVEPLSVIANADKLVAAGGFCAPLDVAYQVDTTTGEMHTGSMVALLPSEPDALTVHDGEPVDQLHVTLWFLGEAAEIPPEMEQALIDRISAAAARTPPIEAQVFGAAVWNPTGDTPCCVLNIGGPGLEEIRAVMGAAVIEAAAGTDWAMPENHKPWAAHVCVAYSDDPAAVMGEALATVGPIRLDAVQVTFGGIAHTFALGGDGDNSPDKTSPDSVSAQVIAAAPRDTLEDKMPFGIRKGGADCPFEVYNTETDERAEGGCHETRQEALDHQKALQSNVPDAAAVGDMTMLEPQPGEHFHAIMHTQGESTGFRTFNDLSWRDVPFAFHWQRSSSAHGGMPETFDVGLVTRVMPDPENPAALHAWGHLDLRSELGAEYARKLVEGFARWVSIGLDEQPVKETIIWPDETADGEDDPLGGLFEQPEQVIIDGGRIGELTGVSVPAQDNATIEPTPELVAMLSGSAEDMPENMPAAATNPAVEVVEMSDEQVMAGVGLAVADHVQALTAAAHRIEIPHVPPRWWFEEPTDVDIAGALYVTDEGRIYGALAPLGVNHRAFVNAGRRQEVPFGNVDYDRFMGAVAITREGRIPAGPVTMDCGHAARFREDHDVAPAHYEDACTVVAKICVGESRERGIVWAAGALEPSVTVDQVSRMLACRLSGDWQPHSDRAGWQELIAALLVPSPGFPMAHGGARVDMEDGVLVASSVPVRAVAGGRPRLRVNVSAGTVERLAAMTPAEQIADVIAQVRGS